MSRAAQTRIVHASCATEMGVAPGAEVGGAVLWYRRKLMLCVVGLDLLVAVMVHLIRYAAVPLACGDAARILTQPEPDTLVTEGAG